MSKKARAVHKIILDIFGIVARFSRLLTSTPWSHQHGGGHKNGGEEEITHPAFRQLEESYRAFRELAQFLYSGMYSSRSCIRLAF